MSYVRYTCDSNLNIETLETLLLNKQFRHIPVFLLFHTLGAAFNGASYWEGQGNWTTSSS